MKYGKHKSNKSKFVDEDKKKKLLNQIGETNTVISEIEESMKMKKEYLRVQWGILDGLRKEYKKLMNGTTTNNS